MQNSKDGSEKVVRSMNNSELVKKKRIVLRYPDGTYAHGKHCSSSLSFLAIKDFENDSWMELKFNEENVPIGASALNIEDEIEFLVNNIEFILEPETVSLSIDHENQRP